MSRRVLLVAVGAFLGGGVALAADEDPVEKKLAAAKEEFEKSAEKARAGLLADLKKKQEAAQKAGNLKALEALQAEAKAFEEGGELPKSVPVRNYQGQLRTARARLEEAYGAAVKQYTKDGKIALAKAAQQEWDELRKGGRAAPGPADAFQAKSVWRDTGRKMTLTVLERKGDKFVARFEVADIVRIVAGEVKGDQVGWLAREVRAVRGGPGGDNVGTIKTDKDGEKIDFVWRGPNGTSGAFTLRLSPGK